jgi:hypothetical protein
MKERGTENGTGQNREGQQTKGRRVPTISRATLGVTEMEKGQKLLKEKQEQEREGDKKGRGK